LAVSTPAARTADDRETTVAEGKVAAAGEDDGDTGVTLPRMISAASSASAYVGAHAAKR
jgi:hypothetical protein